ncbi:MAG: hypothetical protein ACK5MD_09650 [Flavobacteriales bacterium]
MITLLLFLLPAFIVIILSLIIASLADKHHLSKFKWGLGFFLVTIVIILSIVFINDILENFLFNFETPYFLLFIVQCLSIILFYFYVDRKIIKKGEKNKFSDIDKIGKNKS